MREADADGAPDAQREGADACAQAALARGGMAARDRLQIDGREQGQAERADAERDPQRAAKRQPGAGLMGLVSSPFKISRLMGLWMSTDGMADSSARV